MRGGFVALALVLATRAYADDPAQPAATPAARTAADQLYDQGRAAYEANHFRDAIDKFQQAYLLVKDPIYLFNIAQAYRNAADCFAAHEYYKRYLAESPHAENADSVNNWLRELAPCANERKEEQALAHRRVEAPAPAPAPAQLAVTAPAVASDAGRNERLAGLAVGGVGVIGIVVGIAYGIKGQAYEDEIRLACMTTCDWDQLESRHAAGQRANTLSLAGYIGGSLALIGGGALYAHGWLKQQRVTVDAGPTTGGAQISARVRF